MPGKKKTAGPTEPSINHFFPWLVLVLCLVGASFQIWVLWFTRTPLGVSGEWVWPRVSQQLGSLLNLLPAVITAGLLVGYLVWSTRQEQKKPRTLFWLAGLIVLGFGWVVAVQSVTPLGGGLGRGVFVMFYPRTSGYYHQARYEAHNLPRFLSEYEKSISDQSNPENYLHIGTHPPGLTTLHRVLIYECNRNKKLSSTVMKTAPESVRSALQFISQEQARSGRPLTEGESAALWLSVLITQFVSVLTVVPLYMLVSQFGSTSTARMLAGLWLLVPAMIIFLPKSDAAFPCLAMFLQLFWVKALEKNSTLWGVLTAILFVFAASLSLAFFTIGIILFLQMMYSFSRHRTGLHPTIGGIVAGVSCVGLLYYFIDVNLFTVWIQNFKNHSVFYDHNSRTYLDWLYMNLTEGSFAVGVPITICGILGAAFLVKKEYREQIWIFSGLLIWAVLWLSGKNMGEAARLWIFLMPYALLAAAPVIKSLVTANGTWQRRVIPVALLTVQAIVCLLTAIQIDGFGFTQL